MIFITVGTANKGFDRLIVACDEIAAKIDVSFFAQIGSSSYKPRNFPYQEWCSRDEMNVKYASAEAFIVHGGFGTLSEVLPFQKPIIVVPRSFKDGEAVNNQFDLGNKLDQLGYVKCVSNLGELENIISHLNSLLLKPYTDKSNIPQIIAQQIEIITGS